MAEATEAFLDGAELDEVWAKVLASSGMKAVDGRCFPSSSSHSLAWTGGSVSKRHEKRQQLAKPE